MDFFKLRFINVFFLFAIGIALGFLIAREKSNQAGAYPAGNEIPSSYYPKGPVPSIATSVAVSSIESSQNDPTPMDEDDEYQLSVVGDALSNTPSLEVKPSKTGQEEKTVSARKDNSEAFFSSPLSFKEKEVFVKVQMLTARKKEGGWRLNFVYSDGEKNLSYLYVDDEDNISGETPDYKIGYIYNVMFYCGKGELKSYNRLLSIRPTGEKTPWASGVSAVE
ncbi:MAG: hypothetical protein Fur0012_03150 [Elusimicrobiota bacterium]